MKKSLLTATLVAIFGFANAQTDQGGWLVGASSNLGFSSTSYDAPGADNTSSFNFEVAGGYFIMDNLAAGLNIGIANEKEGDDKTTVTAFGPFARYYVNGTFYVGASFAAAKVKNEFTGGSSDFSFSILGLEAGYPIWIVDNVAIEPGLRYDMASGSDITNNNSFGVNIGFNLYF
ncbi:outer membrane beta-barrel protein [Ekhidna sp.]|uniref:outer membrane beta-barrel protein n=1 Tax=Ekhidna sp. TaxID=2608089 RepID=UPI0032EF877B